MLDVASPAGLPTITPLPAATAMQMLLLHSLHGAAFKLLHQALLQHAPLITHMPRLLRAQVEPLVPRTPHTAHKGGHPGVTPPG